MCPCLPRLLGRSLDACICAQVKLLNRLVAHGADWEQVNECGGALGNNSPIYEAQKYYPELYDELVVGGLAINLAEE